jgi:uncharacterized protein (DUF983 family)
MMAEITAMEAIKRGLTGHCPACGKGRIFGKWLKVNDTCPDCGEPLHHHRADDFPAYIVVLLSGHVVVPLMIYFERAYSPAYLTHMLIWIPLTLLICMIALQPVKGAVVGVQWQMGLHGFSAAKDKREGNDTPA